MERRSFVRMLMSGTAFVGLAACTNGQIQIPPLPITLPSNVTAFINQVNDILSKIESLGSAVGTEITTLLGQAQSAVGAITAGGSVASWGSTLLNLLGSVASLLPPPYGLIASAIATLLPTLVSLIGGIIMPATPHLRSRAVSMSVDQAWEVIHSR